MSTSYKIINFIEGLSAISLSHTGSYDAEEIIKRVTIRANHDQVSSDIALSRMFRERLLAQVCYLLWAFSLMGIVIYLSSQTAAPEIILCLLCCFIPIPLLVAKILVGKQSMIPKSMEQL